MNNLNNVIFILAIVFLGTNSVAAQDIDKYKDYEVKNEYTLAQKENGLNGKLQLLMYKNLVWDNGHCDDSRVAVIYLRNKNDEIIDRFQLDSCQASLLPSKELKDFPPWLTVKDECWSPVGSGSGDEISFIRVKNGKLNWLEIKNQESEKYERVVLTSSGRHVWEFTQPNQKGDVDILEVRESGYGDQTHYFYYSRTYKKNGKWIKVTKEGPTPDWYNKNFKFNSDEFPY